MKIQDFMTEEQKQKYAYAAAIADAGQKDRKAWQEACAALEAAEKKAMDDYTGKVYINRFGRYSGGVHPALKELRGYLPICDCYAAA